MSKKKCNTIELKNFSRHAILLSGDDNMAKRNYDQEENYKKRYNLVLYNPEVEPFETILRRYNCISASAFIKKIIRGELKIVEKDENERPQTGW